MSALVLFKKPTPSPINFNHLLWLEKLKNTESAQLWI